MQQTPLLLGFVGCENWPNASVAAGKSEIIGWTNTSAGSPCGAQSDRSILYAVGKWTGVTCDRLGAGQITEIDLRDRPELVYSLDQVIGELFWLGMLVLYGSSLHGTLPPAIGNLRALMGFWVAETHISGTLPSTISNLNWVEQFDIHGCAISGTLLGAIGKLSRVTALILYANQLSGTIPASITNLAVLSKISTYDTRMSGTIPAAIGKLDAIQTARFYSSSISGTIPSLCTNIKSQAQLTTLLVYQARLSGTLPSLARCNKLTIVDASDNFFSGLPRALPPSLRYLYLGKNPLAGVNISEELGALLQQAPQPLRSKTRL
jgi:Leucine-rich repeat (LRR) protein